MKRAVRLICIAAIFIQSLTAQTKPQRRVVSKDAQDAQAQEVAKLRTLRAAKSAAVVVRATTTVSCPEGAPGDCLRTDTDIISQVKGLVDRTNIWEYFEQQPPTSADIFLEFEVRNNSTVSFNVRDTDTNKIIYSEFREVVSLDNDVNRMMTHFLAAAPERTQAEQEAFRKKRECTAIAGRYTMAQYYYQEKLKDYNWKANHPDDAVMNECEEHWKDFVCLKHGQGDYFSNWNESRAEYLRKLKLEYEDLQEKEREMRDIQSAALAQGCRLTP